MRRSKGKCGGGLGRGWLVGKWGACAALAGWLLAGCAQKPADPYAAARAAFAAALERAGLVTSPALLQAVRQVPRHELLAEAFRPLAYTDTPLAFLPGLYEPSPLVQIAMVQAAGVRRGQSVLDLDPGLGYRAALCAAQGAHVHCLATSPDRQQMLAQNLARFPSVAIHLGETAAGCPQHAPYNVLFASWSRQEVPETILDQLRNQGRLVLLPKPASDTIVVLRNQKTTLQLEQTIPVAQLSQAFQAALASQPQQAQ
jgi:protein-L-isoaspartate(D-aspartate) O-methyltransferase